MPAADASQRVGLCSRCRHAARQASAKGSEFWRCRLADSDPRFLRYPPLPVHACSGFEPAPGGAPGQAERPGD